MPIIRDLLGMAMSSGGSNNNGYGVSGPNNGSYYNDNDYRGRPMDSRALRRELRHQRSMDKLYERQMRRENGLIRTGVRAVVNHLGQSSGQSSGQPLQPAQMYEPERPMEPVYPRQQQQPMRQAPIQEQGVFYGRPASPQYTQQGYGQPVLGSRDLTQRSIGEVELTEPPPPYHSAMWSDSEKQPLSDEFTR
ncbi:hypothetical protein CMQ_8010 [Grosmannia clavigera kw1407]|uniref:Uncharacterized protein n=1 Tax=Grosmannia clavigera (strain kw1407 / UAMH 11150) TaxID=655863 RepID=F0XS31_GROCL|nr:uncharacterized protein CMQ_8010 [Grosmannia clavigera kw1407]EFW99642.1 hypothetical protein CMQ_8010 [Grosmannia clavigera kw1407]